MLLVWRGGVYRYITVCEATSECQSALKDRSTNTVDKGTNYNLGDACKNAGTRDKLAREYYKFFHDMTVDYDFGSLCYLPGK